MNIHFQRQTYGNNDVTVKIVLVLSAQERKIFDDTQSWDANCLLDRIKEDRGWVTPQINLSPTFRELDLPGLTISDFSSYFANIFEQRFRSKYEPQIRKRVDEIIHTWESARRDDRFNQVVSEPQPVPNAPPTPEYQPPPFVAPEPKPWRNPEPKEHSTIDIFTFARHRMVPKTPSGAVPVPKNGNIWDCWFGEFLPGETSVRFYLVLTHEAAAKIVSAANTTRALDHEPLFDIDSTDALLQAQAHEISLASTLQERENLRYEHRQQLEDAKTALLDLTIAFYQQYPFERKFDTLEEAREYKEHMEKNVIPKIEHMLGKRQ